MNIETLLFPEKKTKFRKITVNWMKSKRVGCDQNFRKVKVFVKTMPCILRPGGNFTIFPNIERQ